MYLQKVRTRVGTKKYTYLRLVEAYRDNGRVQKRVLAHLGNLDTLDPAALVRLGERFAGFGGRTLPPAKTLEALQARRYGETLAGSHLWDELRLTEYLLAQAPSGRRSFHFPLAVLVMVLNRLMDPRSKLAVTEWQRKIFLPGMERELEYQHFLRALDRLIPLKEPLEEYLLGRLTDLFSLKLNLIFYDLTSSYFEGVCCPIARWGYSRDHRPDARQIVLGLLVTDSGFPIAHEVYEGNTVDKATLAQAVDTLKKRFQIQRVIFVGDRGLVSDDNLKALAQAGYSFILALRKRHCREAGDLMSALEDRNYRRLEKDLWVKEHVQEGIRHVLCFNPEKAPQDAAYRDSVLSRVTPKLEALLLQPKRGRRRTPEGALARAAQLLAKHKAQKFFTLGLTPNGRFFFRCNRQALNREESLDGLYLLKTDVLDLPAQELVAAYKTLSRVEQSFREIKDFLKLRPIFHRAERRVRAHVLVCVLAYLLECMLWERLRRAKLPYSAREAFDHLETLRLVDNRLGNQTLRCVTHPTPEHRAILKAIGISSIPRLLD
jgi:hypothetical protein